MSSPRPTRAKLSRKEPARRKPPAPPAAPALAARAAEFASDVEAALAAGRAEALPPECIQSLMSAACRAYAAHDEAGIKYPPLADKNPTTATDVMVTVSGLLKAAGLQVFELGMWVTYTGR
jgi:hypothetical protein